MSERDFFSSRTGFFTFLAPNPENRSGFTGPVSCPDTRQTHLQEALLCIQLLIELLYGDPLFALSHIHPHAHTRTHPHSLSLCILLLPGSLVNTLTVREVEMNFPLVAPLPPLAVQVVRVLAGRDLSWTTKLFYSWVKAKFDRLLPASRSACPHALFSSISSFVIPTVLPSPSKQSTVIIMQS